MKEFLHAWGPRAVSGAISCTPFELDMSRFLSRYAHRLTAVQYISGIVFLGFFSYTRYNIDIGEELRTDPIASKGIRIVTIAIAATIAIFVAGRRIRWNTVYTFRTMTMASLVLYMGSCILSVPFSIYPQMSLFKSFEIFLAVLLCIIGLTSPATRPDHFFCWNIKLMLLINVIIWIEAVVFPGLAWQDIPNATPVLSYMLNGVYPFVNSNTVGLVGAVLFLANFPRLFESRQAILPVLISCMIGLASLFFSYSRASLIGFIIAVTCSLLMLKRYILTLVITICLLLFAWGSTTRILALDHLARGKEVKDIDTLSSYRVTMWKNILKDRDVLIVGYGYAAGFRYSDFDSGHAHNSIFELYYNNGLIGVLTWLLMIGSMCYGLFVVWRLQGHMDFGWIAIVSVMIFLLIKACAASIFVYLDMQFFLLVSVIIFIERNWQQYRHAYLGNWVASP